jgi:hypothetical protein
MTPKCVVCKEDRKWVDATWHVTLTCPDGHVLEAGVCDKDKARLEQHVVPCQYDGCARDLNYPEFTALPAA